MTITVNVNVRGDCHHGGTCGKEGDFIMAVDNLTASVDRLTIAVDNLAASGGGGGGGVPQADVDVEAARIDEQTTRIDGIVAGGSAAPTPTAAARHK